MSAPKLALTSWSYHRTISAGKMDLAGFIRAAGDIGAQGVDIVASQFAPGGLSVMREAAALAERTGLRLVALGMSGDLTVGDRRRMRLMQSTIRGWISIAQSSGAEAIRIFAGDDSMGDAAEARARGILRAIAPHARKKRIRVAMENHFGISQNPDAAARILRPLPRPWVGACLDIGNFARGDRASLYGVKSLARLAVHVHAKDLGSANAREGLDIRASLRAIRSAGYRGWYSLEYEGEEAEIREVPRAFARMSRALR